jgi:hypothetical protein
MSKPATSTHLFQDFTQLASQALPLIPIITGEVGLPRYLATGDLPARATQIAVDDVLWIPGVYGNVDLTGLPDANVEQAGEGGASFGDTPLVALPASINIASDSLNYGVPFSRIEYAKGPFGADAVRIRFGRALSQRFTTYLNGAVSNSEGQFVDRPYDGHKVSAQFDYRINSSRTLRYRHLNSRNEAGVGVPFFPEEWPGITRAFHKEERVYHALEALFANRLSLRGFVWQVKEELNDPARRNRHRLRDAGTEIQWLKQTHNWALKLQFRLGLEQIKSWSIRERGRFYEQLLVSSGFRLTPKMWLQVAGYVAYKKDWPYGSALEAKWIVTPTPSLTWWLGGGIRKMPPALGERENALPYLSFNEELQAVDLWRGETGINWQRPRFGLNFRLSGSVWQNGLVFRADSLKRSGFLDNSSRSKFILASQLSLHWELVPQVHLYVISAQTINNLPQHFWFWHQPEGHANVYVETRQSLLDGDLEILPRIAGRFVGQRYSPGFATNELRLLKNELPAAALLDLQIRLRHGDGALLFSWENVLNRQFEWRDGVPAVGRFLRWGFWWNFLN